MLDVRSRSTAQSVEWYRQQADESFDAGDYKTALVCYARVSQARPTDLAAAFSLFQCMEAAGQADAAKSLLARLAPVGQAGYPPAQVLFARRLLVKDTSPAAGELALSHLHRAVESGSDDPSLSGLMAEAAARALSPH